MTDNPASSSFSSTHLRRPSWRCVAWRQISKRQRPNHAGEDGGRERPQPALSERVHRLVRPLVPSGFAWGFLGAANVRSWGRRGCRCTGTARSCGAGWLRSAALSPAGSADCAPKWAPCVGGIGWLRSTSQLHSSRWRLRISWEAAGASEKGAGRGDALPLAEGAANYPQPGCRIRC